MNKVLYSSLVAFSFLLAACNTSAPDYSQGAAIPKSACTQIGTPDAGGTIKYQCVNVSFDEANSDANALSVRNQLNNNQYVSRPQPGWKTFNNVTIIGYLNPTTSSGRYRIASTPVIDCQINPQLICPSVLTQTVLIDTGR
jgi:hypothetical protein